MPDLKPNLEQIVLATIPHNETSYEALINAVHTCSRPDKATQIIDQFVIIENKIEKIFTLGGVLIGSKSVEVLYIGDNATIKNAESHRYRVYKGRPLVMTVKDARASYKFEHTLPGISIESLLGLDGRARIEVYLKNNVPPEVIRVKRDALVRRYVDEQIEDIDVQIVGKNGQSIAGILIKKVIDELTNPTEPHEA